MPNLALFDFDGTITTADTFTGFIRYGVDPWRMKLGKVVLAPLIVAYRLGLLHGSPLRSLIVKFGFRGIAAARVQELGCTYCQNYLPKVVRPKALERIKWHQEQGDTVVVVSASLDVYLRGWCESLGVDLLCTELEILDGLVTGRYRGGDCTGKEKARRVRAKYDLKMFPVIYAYGDTGDDEELLNLAHKKYFRWREVHDVAAARAFFGTSSSDPDHKKRLEEIAQEDAALELLVAQQGR